MSTLNDYTRVKAYLQKPKQSCILSQPKTRKQKPIC